MTAAFVFALTILLVAVLTAAATSVRTVSRIWLRHWVERQLTGSASVAALYLERPQRLIIVAGTAIAVTVFVAGVLLGAVAGDTSLARARAVILYAVLLFGLGQILPRAIARRWSTALLPVLLPVLQFFDIVFRPLIAIVKRLTGDRPQTLQAADDEAAGLEELLREGELEGVGDRDEFAIISGVVTFRDKVVRDVMTPRDRIFALDEVLPSDEKARRIAAAGYSRVPVFRGSLDHIVGLVHAFDVLKQRGPDDVELLLRPVGSAGPDDPCHDLLFRMLRERQHLAVVREDGETLGLVTMEDLLEELVGDIRDEHDEPHAGARSVGQGARGG
ncbi:MAG TPA: CNNM domain-containing protein [Gemmatimonadaceae bacterium]|nr:CNNM domain-containing protein [Gemmatimonadaceae bacterium]